MLNMEQGQKTFMKIIQKTKQNCEYINQYHAYHIIIINTAVNTL